MSLSIGQLNLQLVGDAKGLNKMLPDMNRLGKEINKLSKSQESGASKAAASLAKQETAIRKQINIVKALNAQIKDAGGDPGRMGANTQALKAFTKTMSKGKLTAAEFSRAQDRLNMTLARSKQKLTSFNKSAKSGKLNKMSSAMRNLESASVLAVGPLSGIGARIRSLGAIAGRSALKMALIAGAIVAVSVAMFRMVVAAINTAKVMEKIDARLKIVGGSSQQAAEHFLFVVRTATKMGLSIDTAARAYSRLASATKNTAAEGRITRDVFEGLSAAGASLRLSNEEMEGAFRAVTQIASKGKVQAEELIGQLAERVPNAIQIAADAFDTTQAALLQMVTDGLVPASIFLDKFGKQLIEVYGSSALENINSIEGATNRLANAQFLFNKKMDDALGASKSWINFLNTISSIVESMSGNLITAANGVDNFTKAWERFFTVEDAGLIHLGKVWDKAIKGIREDVLGLPSPVEQWINDINNAPFVFEPQIIDPPANNNETQQFSKADLKIFTKLSAKARVAENAFSSAKGELGNFDAALSKLVISAGGAFETLEDGSVIVSGLDPVFASLISKVSKFNTKTAQMNRVNAIFNSTRTEAEKLASSLDEIGDLQTLIDIEFAADPDKLDMFTGALTRFKTSLTPVSPLIATARAELAFLNNGFGFNTDAATKLAISMGGVVAVMVDGTAAITGLTAAQLAQIESLDSLTTSIESFKSFQRAIDETRTPAEALALSLSNIATQRVALGEAFMAGDIDESRFILVSEALGRMEAKLSDNSKAAKLLGDSFANAMEKAIFGGKNFVDSLKGLAIELLKVILRMQVLNALGSSFGGFMTNLGGSAPIPGRAAGGSTPSGVFKVGEKGPELLSMGGARGKVIPNDVLQRANRGDRGAANNNTVVNQTNNFTTTIKDDVRAIIAESTPQIAAATAAALADETKRTGIVRVLG